MAKIKRITAIPTSGLSGLGAFYVQVSSPQLTALLKKSIRFFPTSTQIQPTEPVILYRCNVKHFVRRVGKAPIRLVLWDDRRGQVMLAEAVAKLMGEAKSGSWPVHLSYGGCEFDLRTSAVANKIASKPELSYSPSSQRRGMRYKDVSEKPLIQKTKELAPDEFLLAIFPEREQSSPPVVQPEIVSGKEAAAKLRGLFEELEPQRREIAAALQTQIRSFGIVKPSTLAEGQEIARTVNNILSQSGCCLCFPHTLDPATLGYQGSRNTEPGGFFLAGTTDGKRTSRSIVSIDANGNRQTDDFSVLVVIPAPARRARSK